MSPVLSRRCVLALLMAIWAAFATALLAWGAIDFSASDAGDSLARIRVMGGPGNHARTVEPLLWAALALLSVTAWGHLISQQGRRRASDLSWAWRVLLMALVGRVLCWLLQGLVPSWHLPLLDYFSQASVGVFLFLGLMADRVDTRWGQPTVVLIGSVVLMLAALWYPLADFFSHQPDVRALLMLQILPLLLVPSGLLSLPGRLLRNREIGFISLAYAWTLVAAWPPLPGSIAPLGWADALIQTLPWGSLAALLLLLLLPVVRVQRAKGQRRPGERSHQRPAGQIPS